MLFGCSFDAASFRQPYVVMVYFDDAHGNGTSRRPPITRLDAVEIQAGSAV
jgi:hypothetical protein